MDYIRVHTTYNLVYQSIIFITHIWSAGSSEVSNNTQNPVSQVNKGKINFIHKVTNTNTCKE